MVYRCSIHNEKLRSRASRQVRMHIEESPLNGVNPSDRKE